MSYCLIIKQKAVAFLDVYKRQVIDCIEQGKKHGFKILQFNAVVKNNFSARHLYKSIGFTELGTIPGGFLTKDGSYEDIVPYYYVL